MVGFFTQVLKAAPKPGPETMATPVVFVNKDASKTYTTTCYDTWRIADGTADEHGDAAARQWGSPIRLS